MLGEGAVGFEQLQMVECLATEKERDAIEHLQRCGQKCHGQSKSLLQEHMSSLVLRREAEYCVHALSSDRLSNARREVLVDLVLALAVPSCDKHRRLTSATEQSACCWALWTLCLDALVLLAALRPLSAPFTSASMSTYTRSFRTPMTTMDKVVRSLCSPGATSVVVSSCVEDVTTRSLLPLGNGL